MHEINEFLQKFFDTGSFAARWHCGKWSEFHGWLYILSDVAIWAAYFTIPIILVRFIRTRKDLPFTKIFWLFGAFILACGATHLIDAVIFWFPIYRISAFARLVTAIVSWATIVALYRIMPRALLLQSPKELERKVADRTAELNAALQRMRFMADAMPQIVWTAKADGTLDYFNKRTLEFTGKTIAELEAWAWINSMHPQDQEISMQKWKKALEDKVPFEIENRIQAADGKYYWHLNRGVPQLDENGEIACWVGTATNIEQQKRNEEILEKTVAERTEELRIANENLVQSNNDLEQFAGFASHDLQAPLKTISMYLSMLAERNKDVLDESSLGYISKATAASHRMRTLVQTLLQFSKVNASQTNLTDVDLEQVVQVIRNTMLDSHAPGSVIINNKTPHRLYADESMITQVLQNVIANGIKYNENDVAEITIESAENEDEIVISVTDNGIGIAAEHLEKIFNVFTRLTSDTKGTGLGLSISKRIMEKHKGSISVTSTVGQGTTFTLTIPKA